MTLTYYFGRYDDEEFEYETDFSDYLYDLKKNPKEVVELVKELYDEDEELQKWAKEEFNINSSNDIVLDTDEGKDFSYEALNDIDEDVLYELRRDDIEDYYRDNAEEEYEDYKSYTKDPLGYYGMRQSDFI